MKKTLLALSFAAFFGLKANAQSSTSLQLFDDAVFYNMYGSLVQDEPVPDGAIRNRNYSYGIPLTDNQIATFGNTLTLNVEAASLCDDFDRIGNVNLVFVPTGQTSYDYDTAERIELARFITPFMVPDGDVEVPYSWDISNVLHILHDADLTANYDFWIEFEIAGYQGSPTQGGAAADYPSLCANRQDVYKGSLTLVSSGTYVPEEIYFHKLSYKYELKNYTLDGTDVLGETVKSFTFNVPQNVYGAKYYFINSNHGSNQNGEEYVRRWHFIYLDDVQKLKYKPNGISCEPFRQYNTQPNGIYGNVVHTASWWTQWNNWCPGDKIPIRAIDLGTLTPGDHIFKIDVPDAVFSGGQGYFPMSVYVQGFYDATAGTGTFKATEFAVSPNPVNNTATITAQGQEIKSVSVANTLGQVVLTGTSNTLDLSALQSGMYIVRVNFANNTTGVQKIMKN